MNVNRDEYSAIEYYRKFELHIKRSLDHKRKAQK